MNQKENTETTKTKKRKSGRNWKESYVIFFLLPIILIILFPLGGLFYLWGRFSPYAMSLALICMLYPVIIIFIIYCFFFGIVKLRGGWTIHTWKRKLIFGVEIAIPAFFFIFLITSFFTPESEFCGYGYKLFIYGLRDRIRSKADIGATRDWSESLGDEDYDNHYSRISRSAWAESLKALKPNGVLLSADENDNAKVRLMWRYGPIVGGWGVEIGAENMKIPPSDFSQFGEYRLPVEPGVYVWRGLE